MHPVIMRQFAAEHIREKHAKAEEIRRARRAHEQPSAPPMPVMAGSPPDSGDAMTRREALDHCH